LSQTTAGFCKSGIVSTVMANKPTARMMSRAMNDAPKRRNGAVYCASVVSAPFKITRAS
jgi:hypothetical protein